MVVVTTANLSRDETRTRSDALSVSTYEVQVDLTGAGDRNQAMFPVVSTITFTSKTSETWVDFLDGEVARVTVNGQEIGVEYDGARVQLHGLKTEGDNVVTVVASGRFSRSGQGLHRFFDPADGACYLYTHYEPADARRVFPNFEQPDLKASFVFSLVGPATWHLLANQPEVAREDLGDGKVLVSYAPTPRLSTYITCLGAGPYAKRETTWTAPDGSLEIPMAVYCRQSLAEVFDADEFLSITCQGMDFFHAEFGYPYPWGKYDSIIVPEYNLGAMENPGLVTFTERYVFRSAATRAQYAGRANTILHEMSHMWFGDLVTMQWWDDLWLKESFAEYMGAHSSVAATQFKEAWVAFGGGRKQWAYTQDQLPTTHPIVADIPNLEAARQNFDGITYAKGASVLKQLVAFVGVEEFFEGARRYFQRHAFGNTTLADLLTCLEETSGRDLTDWSARWLQTAGVDRMTPVLELDGDVISSLRIEQDSCDALTGETVGRPHRLGVGLYALDGDMLRRTDYIELDVMGAGGEVAEAVGKPAPTMVLLNDNDLSYVKVRFDRSSLAAALKGVGTIEDPLSRALVWTALWDMVRDAELPGATYAKAVLDNTEQETDAATLGQLLTNARAAMGRYAPLAERDAVAELYCNTAWDRMHACQAGSDAQLLWARAFIACASSTPSQGDRLRRLFDGDEAVEGLEMSPEIRWSLLRGLAAQGRATVGEIEAERERDNTNEGAFQRESCLAGRPDAEAKAQTWRRLFTPRALTNDEVDWMIAGFMQPLHTDLITPYSDDFYASLERVWAEHPIEIAGRLVGGLFPSYADVEPGQDPLQHPELVRAQAWLDEHPDAPGALRRVMLENTDNLRRQLVAQGAAAQA